MLGYWSLHTNPSCFGNDKHNYIWKFLVFLWVTVKIIKARNNKVVMVSIKQKVSRQRLGDNVARIHSHKESRAKRIHSRKERSKVLGAKTKLSLGLTRATEERVRRFQVKQLARSKGYSEVPGTLSQQCSKSSARERAEALEERNGKRREDQRSAGKNLPPKE